MIYNDINETIYFFKYEDLKFYFSSQLYYNKFKNEYIKFIHDESIKIQYRYKCIINFDYMILLSLYKKIEKRGFKVEYKNVELNKDYEIECVINNMR